MIYEVNTDIEGWDDLEKRETLDSDIKLFIVEDNIDYIKSNYVKRDGLTIVLKNPIQLLDLGEPIKEVELKGPNWFIRPLKGVNKNTWDDSEEGYFEIKDRNEPYKSWNRNKS